MLLQTALQHQRPMQHDPFHMVDPYWALGLCRSIHNKEVLETCSEDFVYLACVRFVKQARPLLWTCCRPLTLPDTPDTACSPRTDIVMPHASLQVMPRTSKCLLGSVDGIIVATAFCHLS